MKMVMKMNSFQDDVWRIPASFIPTRNWFLRALRELLAEARQGTIVQFQQGIHKDSTFSLGNNFDRNFLLYSEVSPQWIVRVYFTPGFAVTCIERLFSQQKYGGTPNATIPPFITIKGMVKDIPIIFTFAGSLVVCISWIYIWHLVLTDHLDPKSFLVAM